MSDNFLQVELIVHRDNQRQFEEKVAHFLEPDDEGRVGFGRIDPNSIKELVLGLRSKEPIAYAGYWGRQSSVLACRDDAIPQSNGRKDYFRYVHVWRTDSFDKFDLARLMTLSSESDEYRAIDKLVARETQNFVFRVPWLISLDPLDVTELNVVRVTRELTTAELGSYLFSLGALIPTLDAKGFQTLGYFQNVTGLLNAVTEYWHTNQSDTRILEDLTKSPAEIVESLFESGRAPAALKRDSERRSVYVAEQFVSYLDLRHMALPHVGRRFQSMPPAKPLLSMDAGRRASKSMTLPSVPTYPKRVQKRAKSKEQR